MSTGIEWTDETWNPVTGCSKVSAGCYRCYAETLATTRLVGKVGYPGLPWTEANAEANVMLRPERLRKPLTWREPRMVFVNSMSDLFHRLVPDEYVDRVFAAMLAAPQHTFQVLTKRPERMRDYSRDVQTPHRIAAAFQAAGYTHAPGRHGVGWPMRHVWLGTSIENDRWVDRAGYLRWTEAAVRFISAEPLIGPLASLDLSGIDWLIAGGESGEGHRPIMADWVRDLRDRCAASGTAFFFKQWGGLRAKSGGRTLDGRTWDEMPRQAVAA